MSSTVSKLVSAPRFCPNCALAAEPKGNDKDVFAFDEESKRWARKLVATKHLGHTLVWICPVCTYIEIDGVRPDMETEMILERKKG